MEQQFTATKVEINETDFNIFCVFLSDLYEDTEQHHFLGFQRTVPALYTDPEDENEDEDDGFFVEYNGQENGCYQRVSEVTKVRGIKLSDTSLQVYFTPEAQFHQGIVDNTGDVPLSQLTINFDFPAEQVSSLRAALEIVIGQDCEFLYTKGT